MRRTLRRRAAAIGLAVLVAGLAACSASGSSSSAQGDVAKAPAPAQAQADAGKAGGNAAVATPDAGGRQVITTGSVQVTVSDPRAAADAVVVLIEGEGGRVDARQEAAATDSRTAGAHLTVRVPSDSLTATLNHLKDVGEVGSLQLSSQDVTADSQDLDARIKVAEISVARMEDLLSKAATSADVIAAEDALAQRQTNLETMRSQRARVAEKVALSTLDIDLTTPETVRPSTAPHDFWGGIVVGWHSLTAMLRGLVIVVGVLLPWLVFGGAVTVAVVALVRAVRRRRRGAPGPGAAPVPGTGTDPGDAPGPGAAQPIAVAGTARVGAPAPWRAPPED